MAIVISEEARKATTNCRKNFCCLSDDRERVCKVKECINKVVYFIACRKGEYCPYKISFGNDFICTCPIRKDLYNKYGI